MTTHTIIVILGNMLEQCMSDADLDLITIRTDGNNILLNKSLAVHPQPPVIISPEHYNAAIVTIAYMIGGSPSWADLRRHLTSRIPQHQPTHP